MTGQNTYIKDSSTCYLRLCRTAVRANVYNPPHLRAVLTLT